MTQELVTVEAWRAAPGYEGRYVVSNLGRVRSLVRGGDRLLKPGLASNGYVTVCLYAQGASRGVSVPVQWLVAGAFLGARPGGLHVLHENGDRVCNHVGNLYYGTRSENMYDITRHGRRRLQPEQVREMRARRAAGESGLTLAREFGIHHEQAYQIFAGKQYARV